VIAWWGEHAPDELADALTRCRPELAAGIDAVAPTEWIDLERHLELITALRLRCGLDRFARAYVEAADHALRMPLFEGMIRPLVRLAGKRALFRGFARGWGMIMRGCGDADVARTGVKNASDVRFTAVPVGVARNEPYRESVASVLEALMDRGGFPGTVTLDPSGADRGELRYRLTVGS
jgi:hypothetical protein